MAEGSGMTLLELAEEFANAIPETDEYRDEREFAWEWLSCAALAIANHPLFERAYDRVESRYRREWLLKESIERFPGSRRPMLLRFAEGLREHRGTRWPCYKFAVPYLEEFGLAETLAIAPFFEDLDERMDWVATAAAGTSDPTARRSLFQWALDAVGHDDAGIQSLVREFLLPRLLDEASEAINLFESEWLRDHYLGELEKRKHATEKQRRGTALAGVTEESPWLASEDLFGTELSNTPYLKNLREHAFKGEFEKVAGLIREYWPTKLLPGELDLPSPVLVEVLQFQANAVLAELRNDLKLEFLVDTVVAFIRRGIDLPPAVEASLRRPAFFVLEPASAPSIQSRDPSHMAFDEFVKFLFDRPVKNESDERERFIDRWSGDCIEDIASPATLRRLVTELFERFWEVAPQYSPAQVDEALWYITGFPYFFDFFADDGSVDLAETVACVKSLKHVYSDYVAQENPEGTSYHMLLEYAGRADVHLMPAVLETLREILNIENDEARYAALHGLNHMHPLPEAGALIDEFLAKTEGRLSDELLSYARGAREGRQM